jgi:hypothetical protein
LSEGFAEGGGDTLSLRKKRDIKAMRDHFLRKPLAGKLKTARMGAAESILL